MRRPAPLDIKQKRNAYQRSQSLLPDNRSNQEKRSFDAATEFFKKYKSPLTDTLQSLFGTKYFARAALWLDPYSKFQNTNGIIVIANRFEIGSSFTHSGKIVDRYLNENGKNYNAEAPTVIFPLVMVEMGRSEDVVDNQDATSFLDFLVDTSRKTRANAFSLSLTDMKDVEPPPFGTMALMKHNLEVVNDPHTLQRSSLEYSHLGMPGTFEYQQYTLDRTVQTCFIGGSCTSVSGSVFIPEIDQVAGVLMQSHGPALVQNALASKRLFNAAYQIWELKDIPKLVKQIFDLQLLIQKYRKLTPKSFKAIDKDVSNLYLSWKFGIKSTHDALQSLMDLPEKVTKQLNWLIRRNGKVTSGRSKRVIVEDTSDHELPTFTFLLPNWMSVTDEEVTRTLEVELRCVVEQTIQFPQLAVPSITDKDYLKLIGAVPTLEDFYNVIPFSWLADYFVGIGDYIGLLTAVHDDRQLINYGFLTIDMVETLTHKANITVADTETHAVFGVGLIESTSKERKIPYLKKYTRRHRQRVSVGNLAGVKSAATGQGDLSSTQYDVLAALFSQKRKT